MGFNENMEKLGESRYMALRRFKLLEKRFERNLELTSKDCEFLSAYKNLNHLSLLENENFASPGFYLPHHMVIKGDSITTKIHVVCEGSADFDWCVTKRHANGRSYDSGRPIYLTY